MKKVELGIREELTYNHKIVIEVPEGMTENELDRILDAVQRNANGASDIPFLLENIDKGIKTIETQEADIKSPQYVDVEVEDMEFIEQ